MKQNARIGTLGNLCTQHTMLLLPFAPFEELVDNAVELDYSEVQSQLARHCIILNQITTEDLVEMQCVFKLSCASAAWCEFTISFWRSPRRGANLEGKCLCALNRISGCPKAFNFISARINGEQQRDAVFKPFQAPQLPTSMFYPSITVYRTLLPTPTMGKRSQGE